MADLWNPVPMHKIYYLILLGFVVSCTHNHREFAYVVNSEQVDHVDRIQLVYRDGSIADLKKQSDHWTLNDSLYAWDPPINTLLETMARMRVRFIPTEASRPTILADLATQSVKVNVFEGGKMNRTFYIGGVTEDEQGTYYMAEPDGIPLVIDIPGWQGALRSRFVMGINDWRDRYLMHYTKDEVHTLDVQYPQNQTSGFKMERSGSGWHLTLPTAEAPGTPSEALLDNYWFDLLDVGVESYEDAPKDKQRILAESPYCRITLVKADQTKETFSFYPIQEMGRTERYWIVLSSNGQWILAQTRILQKIFKSNAYFFNQ